MNVIEGQHARRPGCPARVAGGPLDPQLAAANRVEEQTMSRVVARLQRAGYVTRERDHVDRRRLVINRTDRGSQVFARVQADEVSDQLVARRMPIRHTFAPSWCESLRQHAGAGERLCGDPRSATRGSNRSQGVIG